MSVHMGDQYHHHVLVEVYCFNKGWSVRVQNVVLTVLPFKNCIMNLEVWGAMGYAVLGGFFLIGYTLALAVAILIAMPVSVVLTASRANYTPKAVNLRDPSLESAPSNSIFGTLGGFFFCKDTASTVGTREKTTLSFFGRIKRLEGWNGLYRGTVWSILSINVALLIFVVISIIVILSGKFSLGTKYVSINPEIDFLSLLVEFPLTVIQLRAIVHPAKLNWFNMRDSLKKVMSETEYLRPWRLYKIPGAFLTAFLRRLFIGPCTKLIKWILIPGDIFMSNDPDESDPIFSWLRLLEVVPFVGWFVVLVSIITMLDCIFVRLVTQRSEKSYWEKNQTNEMQASDIETLRNKEPIVSLRPCFGEEHPGWNYFNSPYLEPYKGILDCSRKMRDEEGWDSLRRAALFSMVSCLAGLS